MPVNKAYNLEKLVQACREYPLESRKRITFEYILIRNLTDSLEDAKGLIRLLHGVKFKVNLIPFNETPGGPYQRPEWPSICLLYTSPSPRDATLSRMPSSA